MRINVFESGYVRDYAITNLNSARSKVITESYQFAHISTTVFISHKHDDLENLKDIIGFLEKEYAVKAYIDSEDSQMPKITSAETAANIKARIKECRKFILLATENAINSKWCNWELGYGDSVKFPNNIALFLFKSKGTSDAQYIGSEYMKLYPYIVYRSAGEKYENGQSIQEGYYIRTENSNGNTIVPLSEWLSK